MPRRFVSLVALLLPLAAAAQGGGWQLLPNSPVAGRFEDASFVSPTTGWVVDGEGRTHRTTDGGNTWTLRSDVTGYLRSVAFVSQTKGWVGVLFSGIRLYETLDGGATMTNITNRISPAVSGGICGLWAVNADTAYGVGQYSEPAYVIKTTNGGASWQSTPIPAALATSLIDVYFFDGRRGLAVGGTNGIDPGSRAVVLGTEDGGQTWTRRFVSSGTGTTSEWAWKITFPTPEVGYVSIEYEGSTSTGKVLKTTDGGQTWTELPVPGGDSMQGVGFLTPLRGWTSGRGTTRTTTDGGATWAPATGLDGSVNRFEFFGDTLGYAMGQRVYRLRATMTAAEPEPEPTRTDLISVAPNPSGGPVAITYHLATAGPVAVVLFDALGRQVATLASGEQGAGLHRVVWEGERAAGVYYVRLVAGAAVRMRPVVRAGR
ncbi:MAG TPA: T9SS type A sorting domain-containing protein [Rubricoccaceae bacterium]|nr:T9SS type A sorting domain-containing protein [Rubricoccaceae bacterium]